MTARHPAKTESIIAALAGYADDLPSSSGRFSKNSDLMAKLDGCRTSEERLAAIEAGMTPKERVSLRKYVAAITKPPIGPTWLDEQERLANEILISSVGHLAKNLAKRPASCDDESRIAAACNDTFTVGSAPWYASEILTHISHFRRVLTGAAPNAIFLLSDAPPSKSDRLWWIITAAMQLAMIWNQAKIDCAFGKPLTTGIKQTARLGESSRAANAQRKREASAEHARWHKEAAAVWKRRSKLSTSACATAVIKRLKLSGVAVKTVADRIRHLAPPKKSAGLV